MSNVISLFTREPVTLEAPPRKRSARRPKAALPPPAVDRPAADEALSGRVVDAVLRGRIESGEREIFARVTCMRAGRDSGDLAQSTGELVIESFGGAVETVIFTPDDPDLDDAEIPPKRVDRNGATVEIYTQRSRWVFVIED